MLITIKLGSISTIICQFYYNLHQRTEIKENLPNPQKDFSFNFTVLKDVFRIILSFIVMLNTIIYNLFEFK